jgi:DNA-binding transcriptional LysR family regulator
MNGSNGSGLLDWNDARIFLAVARHGSLRAAGRALGISQPTVGRRIVAFEAVFGGPTLFDRLPEGLRLNEAGAALLPVAEQLENAALSLERHRAAAASVLSGTVRISVGEWAAAFLTRHVGSSSENPPPAGITLELVQTIQTAATRLVAAMGARAEDARALAYRLCEIGLASDKWRVPE